MLYNTDDFLKSAGRVVRQKVMVSLAHRGGKWGWKTFGRFAWWWGGFDVLLHHESCDDSRERARVAHSMFNRFIVLIDNELLFL